jgi:hypothetical protein
VKAIAFFRLLLVVQVTCACSSPASPPSVASTEQGKHYERAVLKQVVLALRSTNNVGRIYYEASCPPGALEFPLPFPRVDVLPPLTGPTDLDVVRSIFRQAKETSVVKKGGGIIEIRFGKAPDAILRTRIHKLNLDQYAQFNPPLVIGAIINSPEVRSAMEELHVDTPERVYSMILRQPAEGLPHLPAEISNVTMDQALDMIARTWSGVVLYGACKRRGMYEVSFSDSTHVAGSIDF